MWNDPWWRSLLHLLFVAIKASLWFWKSLENSGNFFLYFLATLDVSRELLQAQSCKMLWPPILPLKQKLGSIRFQCEYAFLTVWHIISQQRCEIERWFQRTTYRKLHIRIPVVTWLMYKYRRLHSCLVNLPFSVSNIPKISHRWSACLIFIDVQCW